MTGMPWRTARPTWRTCSVGRGGLRRRSPHASAPWRCVSLWSRRIPRSRAYRAGLGETYLRLGQVRCDMENLAGAAAAWKRACAHYEANRSLDGEHTFFLACCHAGLAGLAGRPGSGVSAAEGADQAEKAMAVLRQAVTLGYRNPDLYRTESALDPLRNRPDFRVLDDGPGLPDRAVRPRRLSLSASAPTDRRTRRSGCVFSTVAQFKLLILTVRDRKPPDLASSSETLPRVRMCCLPAVAEEYAEAFATLLNSSHRCGSNVTATPLPVCYQGRQFGRLRLDLSHIVPKVGPEPTPSCETGF